MKRRLILWLSMVMLIAVPLLAQEGNIMINGSMEVMEPAFWSKVNDGMGGAQAMWTDDTSHSWYRSFKIMKPSATDDMVGWKSVNNAQLYWNHAKADRFYNLQFWAKTEGVNTDPASSDAAIGVKIQFYSGGNLLGEQFVAVDQSVSDTPWREYTGGVLIPAGPDPDEVYLTAYMGKNATGTVWFDDFGTPSEPWEFWPFNGDCETPVGWMYWTAGEDAGQFKIDNTVAHHGQISISLEDWDSDADELVWYSAPVPAKPNTWYRVSAWVKHDTINTDPSFLPTNVTPVRDDERAGFTFFFHRDPIDRDWSLTPGDVFFYIDQRTASSMDNDWADENGWVNYTVVFKSPPEAAGVSFRARFTSFPTGKVWYDHFSIKELETVVVSVEDTPTNNTTLVPSEFGLRQNYPNPFNPTTIIEYTVPKAGKVRIDIFNALGQKVKTVVDAHHAQGTYRAVWDGTSDSGQRLTSGIYFYRLQAQGALITKKMIFTK